MTEGNRINTILECTILTCERWALGTPIAEPPSHPSNSSALPMLSIPEFGRAFHFVDWVEPGMVGVAAHRHTSESYSGRYASFLQIAQAANIRWGHIDDGP